MAAIQGAARRIARVLRDEDNRLIIIGTAAVVVVYARLFVGGAW